MSNDNTGIEWTDATWNPVTGCSKVSDGCRFCYAETVSHRWGWTSKPWTHPHAAENVVQHPERLQQPRRWTKPRRIFVNSMSDLFHEQVDVDFIDQVFAVMALSPQHTFQILTKRPERMRRYLSWEFRKKSIELEACTMLKAQERPRFEWPLPNVWLGTSVEDQRVDGRVIDLVNTPAAVRFLSCEPLIGALSLTRIPVVEAKDDDGDMIGVYLNALTGHYIGPDDITDDRVHWVIVGGESGANHRPIDPDWVRALRDECTSAGVAFFFKQWGGKTAKSGGKELDGRTWEEMPVRETAARMLAETEDGAEATRRDGEEGGVK